MKNSGGKKRRTGDRRGKGYKREWEKKEEKEAQKNWQELGREQNMKTKVQLNYNEFNIKHDH